MHPQAFRGFAPPRPLSARQRIEFQIYEKEHAVKRLRAEANCLAKEARKLKERLSTIAEDEAAAP